MTLVDHPRARRGAGWRRAWDLPVRAHLAALALVLLALVPLIGTGASFSADEGAAIVQARSLSGGGGWIVEHPLPEVDPDGRHYPLELSASGPDGTAPFAKHPLYALMLAAADRAGGVTAMVLLSLAGTLAAAGLAVALATRLDPVLARPTLWVVGLGSPLLLDGFLVIAHTLAAAAAAGAVLCAVTALERRSPLLAAGVVPCVGVAVLLRNEALFLALGLALAAGVMARTRTLRVPALVVAVGAAGAAAVAHLGENLWIARILGGEAALTAGVTGGASQAGLQGRIDGFVLTWLTPNYTDRPLVGLLLLLMVAAVVVAALGARHRPQRPGQVQVASAVAAVAAVGGLAADPRTVVPGLLVAFPLAAAGLALLGRRSLDSADARLAAGTAAVFALAVAATQYRTGGSGEWGGRYFALAVPVVVPVLLLALYRQRDVVGPAVARRAAACLAVCSVAMSVMAVGSISNVRRVTADLVAAVERATPEGAVVVTTYPAMPRLAWPILDQGRWLLTTPADLDDLVRRLRAAGVDRFTFVTRDLAHDGPQLAGLRVVSTEGRPDGRGAQVLVVDTGRR